MLLKVTCTWNLPKGIKNANFQASIEMPIHCIGKPPGQCNTLWWKLQRSMKMGPKALGRGPHLYANILANVVHSSRNFREGKKGFPML